jgi:ATP synthase mitochondrial F1 complex assembly factor 2
MLRASLTCASQHGKRLAACQSRWMAAEVAPASGRLTDLSGLGPKRFYKEVDVLHDREQDHYAVTIDGRRVRTPKRSVLNAPTEALALAMAAEWDAQGARIRPSSMPVTSLVSTGVDIIPEFRPQVVSSILKYFETDTLCIRPAHPDTLVDKQTALYTPIVEHLRQRRGLELNVTIGGLFAPQSREAHEAVSEFIHSLSDLSLATMDSAAATAKSVAIALALFDGKITAEGASAAARSEEGWQESVWGTVEGGHDLDSADNLVRLSAADTVFQLVALAPEKFLSSASAV